MSLRPVVFGGLLASLLLVPNAFADMGRVTVSTEGVQVSEDAQKAIILHNNREEVLILGTELRADRQTPIVRFIPFPSEPQVSLAPKDVFERLAVIVNTGDDIDIYGANVSPDPDLVSFWLADAIDEWPA